LKNIVALIIIFSLAAKEAYAYQSELPNIQWQEERKELQREKRGGFIATGIAGIGMLIIHANLQRRSAVLREDADRLSAQALDPSLSYYDVPIDIAGYVDGIREARAQQLRDEADKNENISGYLLYGGGLCIAFSIAGIAVDFTGNRISAVKQFRFK